MNFYVTAILLGLGFASLALGIFISMRIFNIPDITTDGSFTLGGAVTAVMITHEYSVSSALALSFLAGSCAGMITGLIHTKLKVNALLAGILVMTALYSVNLAIMGRSNIPLIGSASIFDSMLFLPESVRQLVVLLLMPAALWILITWLL